MDVADGWELVPDSRFADGAVEWVDAEALLYSRGARLYEYVQTTGEQQLLADFPTATWKQIVTRTRLGQRLLRQMYYNVLRCSNDELFLSFAKAIAVCRKNQITRLEGLRRSFRILRGAVAVDGQGHLFFGEYFGNSKREAVHIYRYVGGSGIAEVVHTFAPGEVRHVHGIYHDPFDGSLWCLTGDRRDECRILRSEDGFASATTVGQGDESWRAVSVLFAPEGAYYAMDAEFEQNYLYRLDRNSGRRERIAPIDGPVYYSQKLGSDLLFAVTAELCPSQSDRHASLWHVAENTDPQKILSLPKDRWHKKLFMPGTIHFPYVRDGNLEEGVLLSGVGLQPFDGGAWRLRRKR